MSSPFERMQELAAAGVPFAVATVIRTQGSTPQVVGAKLLLTGDASERPFGTLGGGCVEADAIDAARKVLAGEPGTVREHQLTEELAWDTGLVCGGTMWILAEAGHGPTWPPAVDGIDAMAAAADAARGGPPVAFVSAFERTGRTLRLDARVLVLAGGRMLGTLGSAGRDERARDAAIEQMRHGTARLVPLDDAQELLVEAVTSRPQLVIAGGGHVSRAIARQARLLDFDVAVIEDRPAFADPERFDGASVVGGDLIPNIAAFPYNALSYLVVATRGHKLDAACVAAAVRTRVPYIGLLGSRRKTILIADMLRGQGVDESRIAAIHAPVGLDLGGRTPAEIALSVLAEITQLRYQGTGRPLRDRLRDTGEPAREPRRLPQGAVTRMHLDRAAREREYSPSSVIGGDYAPVLARYRAESDAALRTLAVQHDLRYGDASRALIDFFPPPTSAGRPGLLVYLHGGYWQELSKAESAFLAPAWHAAGFAHAVVGYSLAPAAGLPDIVGECRAAIAWLHARADRLGFDAGRIVVAGSSAGAYLAAACADTGLPPLRGIVPVSGIFDVAPLIDTTINDALRLDEATAAALDLLTTARRFCPAVVAWGEIETAEFKRQSRTFAARLASDGIPCSSLEVPGRNHFDVVFDLADPTSPLFTAARALFTTGGQV